jgi:tRNA A37 threonylcarbamoyladenosine dehydratase
MTPADRYRLKAGDLASLARAETDPFGKAEYEKLSQAYLRLAEQAERNSRVDLVYETPPPRQPQDQPQVQQQQQSQPEPDRS